MKCEASILVIDDSQLVRDMLAELLGKEGYSVSFLSSSEGAVDAIKARKPDLVILDVMLPGMIDGFGICHDIKADPTFKNIPILILSAVTKGLDMTDESVQIKSGADAFMSKSLEPEQLLATVKKLLAGKKERKNRRKG